MSVQSIALALRKSPLARLAVFPALALLACACVGEPLAIAPFNNVIVAVSPTPQAATNSQEPPTPTPAPSEDNPPESDANLSLEIPSPAPPASLMPDQGFLSLEERILRSSVIARATMRSVSAHARGYDGHADTTIYFPILRFSFNAREYLKGNGNNTIIATIKIACPSPDFPNCRPEDKQKAIDYANSWIANKSERWWEDRESIIFLTEDELSNAETTGQSDSTIYKFTPQRNWRYPAYNYTFTYEPYFSGDEYSVLSERNRVWLPITATSSSASGANDSRFMLGDKPKDLYPDQGVVGASFDTEISLADLKSRIKAVANLVSQGKGVADYEKCLRIKYENERIPWEPYSIELPIESGLASGAVITSGTAGGHYYRIYFFSGPDKDFFEIVNEDDDEIPHNGYHRTAKTLRPLAAGEYSLVYHQMLGILRLCIGSPVDAYTDTPTANWTIRATSPAGTLHEAFFDPIAIGASVGVDSANGILTPAAFQTASGADAELRRIDWASDAINIEIANPPASLADHHIDFIALDGSIALRLDFGDAAVADAGAVRTFSWGVCGRPWHAGDKLMMRISESAAGLAEAASQASCEGEDALMQTPVPSTTFTPESSTPASPTPTSVSTVAPDAQPPAPAPSSTAAPTPR